VFAYLVVYVDDILLVSPTNNAIKEVIVQLKEILSLRQISFIPP
jgi:hypothetical protein